MLTFIFTFVLCFYTCVCKYEHDLIVNSTIHSTFYEDLIFLNVSVRYKDFSIRMPIGMIVRFHYWHRIYEHYISNILTFKLKISTLMIKIKLTIEIEKIRIHSEIFTSLIAVNNCLFMTIL